MPLKSPASPKEFLYYAIVLIIALWLIYTYQILFGPLIVSALVAYLLYPSVTWLSKKLQVPRRRVVWFVYAVFLLLVVWAIIFLVPRIASQAAQLTMLLDRLPGQVRSLEGGLQSVLGFRVDLAGLTASLEEDITQFFRPERILRVLLGATTNILWVVIIFLTSFHLLRDWERLREWLFGLVPRHLEPDYRRLHHEIKAVWRAYLRGQVLIMFLLGLISGVGAAAIGLPSPLVLGLLAGTLALIPNVGPATATGIAAAVAWTQGSSYLQMSDLSLALLTVAIFTAVQGFEGFFLTPRIMSRRMEIHPGVVLLAIVGTLLTLGALTALIIVPLLSSLMLIARYVRRKRAGLDPWEPEQTEPTQLPAA